MKRATAFALLVAVVALFSTSVAHAGVVYNGYAGSDSAFVTSAKYPAVCWLMPATVVVNSISVGISKTGGAFIIDKLVGPYNAGIGTLMWSFGTNDVQTVSSGYQTISTTTRTYTLLGNQTYCVYTGSNAGTEKFNGSATDGSVLSASEGNSLAQVIANTRGGQVAYFGSSNVWLCDGAETACGGVAPRAGLSMPAYPTSTSALGSWFSGAVSSFNSVPPWSYWVQLRTELNDDRGLLTSASSTPYTTFIVGASTTPLHIDVSLFTQDQFTTLIPLWLWTIIKYTIATAMWAEFALLLYHEVDRRFTKPHS